MDQPKNSTFVVTAIVRYEICESKPIEAVERVRKILKERLGENIDLAVAVTDEVQHSCF